MLINSGLDLHASKLGKSSKMGSYNFRETWKQTALIVNWINGVVFLWQLKPNSPLPFSHIPSLQYEAQKLDYITYPAQSSLKCRKEKRS